MGDDDGNGTAVDAGVGAAVGDESGTVDGIGVGDDAGIGTADRGWRLSDRPTARGLGTGDDDGRPGLAAFRPTYGAWTRHGRRRRERHCRRCRSRCGRWR